MLGAFRQSGVRLTRHLDRCPALRLHVGPETNLRVNIVTPLKDEIVVGPHEQRLDLEHAIEVRAVIPVQLLCRVIGFKPEELGRDTVRPGLADVRQEVLGETKAVHRSEVTGNRGLDPVAVEVLVRPDQFEINDVVTVEHRSVCCHRSRKILNGTLQDADTALSEFWTRRDLLR